MLTQSGMARLLLLLLPLCTAGPHGVPPQDYDYPEFPGPGESGEWGAGTTAGTTKATMVKITTVKASTAKTSTTKGCF